jgi:hypothetical protein
LLPLFRGWRDDESVILGARPTLGNSSLPLAVGFATTVISFVVLQILLIALAFGAGDYDRGRPGIGATGFPFWSAIVMALSGGLGASVSASQLRRADVEERGSRRVAMLAPALVALGIAISGLTAGSGPKGALVVVISTGLAIAFGSRLGSRAGGAR